MPASLRTLRAARAAKSAAFARAERQHRGRRQARAALANVTLALLREETRAARAGARRQSQPAAGRAETPQLAMAL